MNQLTDTNEIYEGIDRFVDAFYTSEINNLIEDTCKDIIDKRVFMMFIIMYFHTFLHIKLDKIEMKKFLTAMIKDPYKRQKCINLYLIFEKTSKQITQ